MLTKTIGSRFFVSRILLLVLCFQLNYHAMAATDQFINIGVIRNLSSPFSNMINLCIDMANSDFYSENSNYKTRLQPRIKDVKDVLDVDLAVLEFVEHEQVHAILEPEGSTDEIFVSELARRAQVPIVSFAPRGSSLLDTENHFYFKTSIDDSFQAKALAAICHEFKWEEVVILYEDTEFGYQFLSHLSKALQVVEIGLANLTSIPASANETRLLEELNVLKNNQTVKVFVVHMNPSLGSLLFALAKREGMMSEGYAWIITDSLSNFLNFSDPKTRDSMEGVVGIRPYIPFSENLENFQERWKRNSTIRKIKNKVSFVDLNVYGLWAYDTVTALAKAVENEKTRKNMNLTGELSSNRFPGLSGDFRLANGRVNLSAVEIFNVNRTGENTLGFWTPDRGIIEELKKVEWPGGSERRPNGWSIPPTGPVRVGVPCTSGYTGFVRISERIDNVTNQVTAIGFAIDIFWNATKRLPFDINPIFYCYNDTNNRNWTYDDMLKKIPEKYDMVVADVTLWASRTEYVDFSLPYLESGMVLVVRKEDFGMWSFTMPLNWDLWLAIALACISMGIIIWVLERPRDKPARGEGSATPNKPPGMTYLAPVAFLAFQERNMVSNKWSLFVLVCWLFMAVILMQSFTANLSAILTVDQLKFAFSEGYHLGYRGSSFTRKFLISNLNIDESRLKGYSTNRQLHDAISKGSKNGGIDAIFDEIPYMNLLMDRYKSKYKVVGPTYRTNGFGFAFQIGSPLAAHYSKAILEVTDSGAKKLIERQNYRDLDISSLQPHGPSRLTFLDFSGLFILIASFTVLAIVGSETTLLSKLNSSTRQLINKCFRNDDNENAFNADTTTNPHEEEDEHLDRADEAAHDQDGSYEEIVEVMLISNDAHDVDQHQDAREINSPSARNHF